MVSRKLNWLNLVCLMLIPLIFAVGCAKREAQKELQLATEAKTKASEAQAPGYVPNEFDAADARLSEAQNSFDAGEYDQAITASQDAAARFDQAERNVASVKEKVDAARSEIQTVLETAEANIQTAREAGVAAEEINPVNEIVAPLRTRYDDEFSRKIVDLDQLAAFRNEVQQAEQKTQSLATAHLRPQAEAAVNEVQALIDEAKELQADTQQPDAFTNLTNQFAQIQALFQSGQWQQVIDQANALKTPFNDLITAAQEKAAAGILENTQSLIAQARQMNVELPAYGAALDQAQAALDRGRTELQNNQFAAAIGASDEAKNLIAQANQSLGAEAQTLIQTAQSNLAQAGGMEGADFAAAEIAGVSDAIGNVQNLLQGEQYAGAYSTAQKTVQASEAAIESARSGKARAALAKAEEPFRLLESQGGAQYAVEAYRAASRTMENLRSQLNQGQFQAVEEGAGRAIEQINAALEQLDKAAVDQLGKAQEAINDAQASNAQETVAMQYANAVNLRSAAEQELQANRYLSSIRKAEQAIQTADEAQSRSYIIQAEQNLRKASDFIALAQQANQPALSPLAYRNALDARNRTQDLLRTRQAEEAYNESLEAARLAERAYNNMVMTAREAAQAALDAGAMDYSQQDAQEALRILTEAESAQASRDYNAANERSAQSIKLAEQAEYETWRQRSAALLRDLEGIKERLDAHNSIERAPALYKAALSNFADAKAAQIDEDYEASFAHADAARDAEEQTWEGMRNDLNRILTELQTTASWMGENALDQSGREIKIEFSEEIVELRRQIALENWTEAYRVAAKAEAEAKKATDRLQDKNRRMLAQELQAALAPYNKQKALTIVPEQQAQIKDALKSLNQAKDQATYGEAYQKYQAAMDTTGQLPELIGEQAQQRTDEIAQVLQQAQQAGARKYYRDKFDQLASDLQWLRNSVRGEDYKGIAERLARLEKEAPEILANTQLAVREDEYFQALNLNLTQMNNLVQDFDKILSMPVNLFIAARLTEYKLDSAAVNAYDDMQEKMSARTFRLNAEILEERVLSMTPPESLKAVQTKAEKSFEYFRKAAEGFELYGNNDAYDIFYREKKIKHAYELLEKSMKVNADLQFVIDSHRKLSTWEKLEWKAENLEDKFADFYYSWKAK